MDPTPDASERKETMSIPDKPKYDPDRTIFQDVNLDELSEADRLAFIDSYLNDPVAEALADDLGRLFRRLPAEEQIAQLVDVLASSRERQRDVAQRLEGAGLAPELRDGFETLKRAVDGEVERIEARLRELSEGGS